MINNPKILIIDDIVDNILTVKALIKKNFPTSIILSATNGHDGVELIQSTVPDVILLDVLMPGKDGFEVCEDIKKIPSISNIPVVFVTALKDVNNVRIKALSAGAEGFINKPIDEPTLIATLNAMLKVREGELFKENENERLRLLVKERTHKLKKELNEKEYMANELQNSQQRYQGLLENLDSGIVIHNPDTTIINANKIAADILGVESSQLQGKQASDSTWYFINENEEKLTEQDYPVNIIKETLLPIKDYVVGTKSDKEIKWVSVNGYPRFNADGSLKEIVISFRDITNVKDYERNLVFLANNDYLTKLFNRRYFEEQLIKLNKKNITPVAIAIADINGLKLMNDAFGHIYGDELLIEASKVIRKSVRPGDIVARIGGDEFGIIMLNTNNEEAEKVVRRIHENSKKVVLQSIELSISVGYSIKTDKNVNLFTTSRTAEDIMYRQKIAEIPSMRSNAIETILSTLYEKDEYSESHSRSVSEIATNLAKSMDLSDQHVNDIKSAGLLHDIGKIIIPSEILTKDGKLDVQELDVIRNHPEIGFRILNSSSQLRSISRIVLNHHEFYDGTGYPQRISGEDIPLESRIICVADAFDAMTSERTYRKAYSFKRAKQELLDCAGTQFDPNIVKIFIEKFDEIVTKPDIG